MKFLAVAFVALTAAGCATVTRGTTNQVTFTSEPPEAAVRTSVGHSCKTPCTLEISRKAEFVATFELDGHKKQEVTVATRIAGAGAAGFAGNALLGGLIGMGVDAATGSTLEHFPNPVFAKLEKESVGPTRANAKKLRPVPQKQGTAAEAKPGS